ncbi:Uncharacterised protein [Klebsiella variicola]|nr:Uncharacterised protein [Klebsiella variicola]
MTSLPAFIWPPATVMSPPVAVTARLFPAFRVLPLVVTCSECDREEEDCEPSDALIPIVLLLSLSLPPLAPSSATAWAAWIPESAAFVPWSALRRPSLTSFAFCAAETVLFTAPPALPDRTTVSPLDFCSNFSSTVRVSCPGSITTLSPVMRISRPATTSEPPICACLPAEITTLPPVLPVVEALWLWVVPASRSSCVVLLLPIENPIPPVPVRPDFFSSLNRQAVSVLVAAVISILLPAWS